MDKPQNESKLKKYIANPIILTAKQFAQCALLSLLFGKIFGGTVVENLSSVFGPWAWIFSGISGILSKLGVNVWFLISTLYGLNYIADQYYGLNSKSMFEYLGQRLGGMQPIYISFALTVIMNMVFAFFVPEQKKSGPNEKNITAKTSEPQPAMGKVPEQRKSDPNEIKSTERPWLNTEPSSNDATMVDKTKEPDPSPIAFEAEESRGEKSKPLTQDVDWAMYLAIGCACSSGVLSLVCIFYVFCQKKPTAAVNSDIEDTITAGVQI
jgi:hypothetical protein